MISTDAMIATLQEYYGMVYAEGMARVVIKYLDSQPAGLRPHLMAEAIKAHGVSFRSLPDVAVFEDVMKDARSAWDHSSDRALLLPPVAPRPEELATDDDLDAFAADIKSIMEAKNHAAVDALVAKWKQRVSTARDRREPYKD